MDGNGAILTGMGGNCVEKICDKLMKSHSHIFYYCIVWSKKISG